MTTLQRIMPSLHPDYQCDILVIGAGIGGASAAAQLVDTADILVIEAEEMPGYHTTGRSAAFYAQSYGGPAILPLTNASQAFYLQPPKVFSDAPLMTGRGCLHIYGAHNRDRALRRAEELAKTVPSIGLVSADEALARVPVLRPEGISGAMDDPDCCDLDVGAIHQGYLKQLRRGGGRLLCDARLQKLEQISSGFMAYSSKGTIKAAMVVNAAGAWADDVARMAGVAPVGLQPMRRTAMVFKPKTVAISPDWPLVIDIDETLYFKPEAGQMLASPADETPMNPCDVQPEDLDIAKTIDRIERISTLDVPSVGRKWAGLRSFAPDRVPVVGRDPDCAGFIWCAGQGGYGIQTAPAMAALTKAVTLSEDLPDWLAAHAVAPERYAPARFRL